MVSFIGIVVGAALALITSFIVQGWLVPRVDRRQRLEARLEDDVRAATEAVRWQVLSRIRPAATALEWLEEPAASRLFEGASPEREKAFRDKDWEVWQQARGELTTACHAAAVLIGRVTASSDDFGDLDRAWRMVSLNIRIADPVREASGKAMNADSDLLAALTDNVEHVLEKLDAAGRQLHARGKRR